MIEQALNLCPRGPALNIQDFMRFIELELFETAHVEHRTIFGEGLPPHAVALPRHGHLQVIFADKPQGILNVFDSGDFDNSINCGLIQATCVIYEPPQLCKRGRLHGRPHDDGCRLGLVRDCGKDEITAFRLGGRRRIVKNFFDGK